MIATAAILKRLAGKEAPASPPPVQARSFPFRTMLSISGARSMLPGLGENEILKLIEGGYLEIAFNIGADERAYSREIRILPACIDHYQAHAGKTFLDWDWPKIAHQILNGYRLDWITGTDLRLLLNCSPDSISRLIQRNHLTLAPGSSCRRGPKGSPRLLVSSFLNFLQKRRVT